jgi:hypothetical protein
MSHDIEITVKLNERHLRAMLECFPPAFLGSIICNHIPNSAVANKPTLVMSEADVKELVKKIPNAIIANKITAALKERPSQLINTITEAMM